MQDLVAKALADSKQSDTDAVISAWNAALAAQPTDPAFSALADSESRRARSVSALRGAAAATIFSLLLNFGNLIFSVVAWPKLKTEDELREEVDTKTIAEKVTQRIAEEGARMVAEGGTGRSAEERAGMIAGEAGQMIDDEMAQLRAEERAKSRFRWIFFGLAIFDSLLFAGGLVCFAYAMVLGPSGLTNNSGDPSGGQPTDVASWIDIGAFVAVAGFVFKLISVPAVGFIVLCIFGFYIVIFGFVVYLALKCTGKAMNYPYPGYA